MICSSGTTENQDYGWLGKGGAIVKALWIGDNANTRIHNGSNPKKLTIDVGTILDYQKLELVLVMMEQLLKNNTCSKKLVNNYWVVSILQPLVNLCIWPLI